MDGLLSIFKGAASPKPWCQLKELGTITCLAVGDVCNQQKNCLVVITAEGFCHIIDFSWSQMDPEPLKPRWSIPIPVNVSRILIEDYAVDNDGRKELILGRTDRVLHAFQIVFKSERSSSEALQQQQRVTTPAMRSASASNASSPIAVISGNTGTLSNTAGDSTAINVIAATAFSNFPLNTNNFFHQQSMYPVPTTMSQQLIMTSTTATTGVTPSDHDSQTSMFLPKLMEKQKWQFSGQLGSLDLIRDPSPRLLVAQPGLNFYMLRCSQMELPKSRVPADDTEEKETAEHDRILFSHFGEMLEVATELITNVTCPEKDGQEIQKWTVVCTMDGQMKWCQPSTSPPTESAQNDSSKFLDLQVKNQLFSLGKITVSPNNDYVVTCAWNGTTFLVDGQLNVAQFQFPERVCAFRCGDFCISPGVQIPCLVYVTFNDEIYIYYNIDMKIEPRQARSFDTDVLPILRKFQDRLPDSSQTMTAEDLHKNWRQLLFNPTKR